ncbi:MAG TPA: class I SAM-dependent methyltransferase [Acidimicrobiales bacterium]|jgi:SAM-dependent methyltransferase|nr:class I SAM-dependent methyltransferase [Acidimicrobiales bacterium]
MARTRSCPACDGETARCLGLARGYLIFRCHRCGTDFASETGSPDFGTDYEGYYSDENLTSPEVVHTSLDRTLRGFDKYRATNRLLDVGFGAADVLQAARRAGWEPAGVEVSKPAVENARAQGFDVAHGTLEDATYPDDSFDVVVSTEVLEHVPFPRQMLDQIFRVLRPGGLLWATTPHGGGVSGKLLGLDWSIMAPPEHLQLFSLAGIKRMMTDSGYRIERVVTESVNPYNVLQELKGKWFPSRAASFDRMESNRRILEVVYASPGLTKVKAAVDAVLHVTRLGDGLRVWATKPGAGDPQQGGVEEGGRG